MDTRADVITTMGQLSNIVYNDNKEGIDYFKNGGILHYVLRNLAKEAQK